MDHFNAVCKLGVLSLARWVQLVKCHESLTIWPSESTLKSQMHWCVSVQWERQTTPLETLRPASLRNTERSRNKKDPDSTKHSRLFLQETDTDSTRWQVRTGSRDLFSNHHLSWGTIPPTLKYTHQITYIWEQGGVSICLLYILVKCLVPVS